MPNFCEKYKTLTKFQERLQFKFDKSCSYLLRGKGGAGKGKQSSLSLKEHVENRNFTFIHPNTISKRNPAPTLHSTAYKEEILTCIDLLLGFKVKPVEPQKNRHASPGGGGVLPYMGYIGMCGPKKYGFSAVLVINRVSIIAIVVLNRVPIFAL